MKLAATLDAKSFVTVPFYYRGETVGRLYVEAPIVHLPPSDMRFLVEVLDHVNPIVENIELVELLADHAADDERDRIARTIHDSVIQPYVGLRLGLAAIRNTIGEKSPAAATQIEHLISLAQGGIDSLRQYVTGLKDHESTGGLLPAMRRFAARFTAATGLAVRLEIEGDVRANNRLAAEAFQMMVEGLSNVRRHTHATGATVRLDCHLGRLRLEIAEQHPDNRRPVKARAVSFTPASIAERAAALGGKVQVKHLDAGGSAVVIDIPL